MFGQLLRLHDAASRGLLSAAAELFPHKPPAALAALQEAAGAGRATVSGRGGRAAGAHGHLQIAAGQILIFWGEIGAGWAETEPKCVAYSRAPAQ